MTHRSIRVRYVDGGDDGNFLANDDEPPFIKGQRVFLATGRLGHTLRPGEKIDLDLIVTWSEGDRFPEGWTDNYLAALRAAQAGAILTPEHHSPPSGVP